MNLRKMILGLFALLAFFPLMLPAGMACAQQSASSFSAPRISGFDVAPVGQLVAGTELNFTLYGTPGGIATITIPGATMRLVLQEVEAGLYEGAYTIRTLDQIVTSSAVTANLRLGNQVANVVLDESLIASSPKTPARRMAEAASSSTDPRIDRFDVEPNRLVPGSELIFTLYGTPGGKTSMRIAGVTGRVFLDETRDGIYQGVYTIKTRDRIAPDSRVTANLRLGDRESSAILGKSLLATSDTRPSGRQAARNYATEPGFRMGDRVRVENGTLVRDQ